MLLHPVGRNKVLKSVTVFQQDDQQVTYTIADSCDTVLSRLKQVNKGHDNSRTTRSKRRTDSKLDNAFASELRRYLPQSMSKSAKRVREQ